jgi:hypothetical protein
LVWLGDFARIAAICPQLLPTVGHGTAFASKVGGLAVRIPHDSASMHSGLERRPGGLYYGERRVS